MQYPLISEYVRAIQDASNNLDKLAYLVPVLDDHGEPYRSSGAFAVVFKMKDEQTGKYYALKCFTEEQEGRAEAYRQIADELEFVDSSYITSVKYLDKEIFVDSSCEEDEFPVLLMDWVEGETMETYIANNYQDEYAMGMLCYRFCKMAAWLRSQPFAHGDIKPDNIIVRPDGTLTLVDYDGMFVPAMNGQKSPTIGTKDFSHPLRTVDDFDETIDDFALASIALSLKAISLKPSLLDEYGSADRLLFSADDCRDLSKSKVMAALHELVNDEEFTTLLSMFLLANAKKNLAMCSFRLFVVKKPECRIEVLSTKVTDEDLKNAVIDEYGVKYSRDGKKILSAQHCSFRSYKIKRGTKVICNKAFFGCKFLTIIDIPDSVTYIGANAFSICESLSSIVFPEGVKSICGSVFEFCNSLSQIILPSTLEEIKGNPFEGWNGQLHVLSSNFVYDDGVLFDKNRKKIVSFRKDVYEYRIPDGVTSIGDNAFSYSSLKRLVIATSVVSIGNSAFCYSSLEDIVIHDGVEIICDEAFTGCFSLKEIVIPFSVKYIEGNPFENWNGKLRVLSPNFVYDAGVLFDKNQKRIIAFRGHDVIYFIPESVACIGRGAFGTCISLIGVVIPKSVTSIGERAFSWCDSLTKIDIPNSVTSVGKNAFSYCESLPSSIKNDIIARFGKEVFGG